MIHPKKLKEKNRLVTKVSEERLFLSGMAVYSKILPSLGFRYLIFSQASLTILDYYIFKSKQDCSFYMIDIYLKKSFTRHFSSWFSFNMLFLVHYQQTNKKSVYENSRKYVRRRDGKNNEASTKAREKRIFSLFLFQALQALYFICLTTG